MFDIKEYSRVVCLSWLIFTVQDTFSLRDNFSFYANQLRDFVGFGSTMIINFGVKYRKVNNQTQLFCKCFDLIPQIVICTLSFFTVPYWEYFPGWPSHRKDVHNSLRSGGANGANGAISSGPVKISHKKVENFVIYYPIWNLIDILAVLEEKFF